METLCRSIVYLGRRGIGSNIKNNIMYVLQTKSHRLEVISQAQLPYLTKIQIKKENDTGNEIRPFVLLMGVRGESHVKYRNFVKHFLMLQCGGI